MRTYNPVIGKVLSEMPVSAEGMDEVALVRSIQRAEGNFDCFGKAVDGVCDQENCMWREACIPASAAGKKN